MKLYDVPSNTKIRLLEDPAIPPASKPVFKGQELEFEKIDGMYSRCWDVDGERVYIAGYSEVEIVE